MTDGDKGILGKAGVPKTPDTETARQQTGSRGGAGVKEETQGPRRRGMLPKFGGAVGGIWGAKPWLRGAPGGGLGPGGASRLQPQSAPASSSCREVVAVSSL